MQAGPGNGRRTEAERILSVLETIKKEGLKGIGNFIVLALSSEDPRVKSHILPIYQSKGKVFNILRILLDSCILQRRQTGKYIRVLREKLGDAIQFIFEDMVDLELKDVMHDTEIHHSPSSLNTNIVSEFAFGNLGVGRRWGKRLSSVVVYLDRPVVVHGNSLWFGGALYPVERYVFAR